MLFRPPIPVDATVFLKRLTAQEREILHRLAELENQIRRFEDFELPAYTEWLRLELGPGLVVLEEIFERIHERRILVQKVNNLLESQNLSPREALYLATQKHYPSGSDSEDRKSGSKKSSDEATENKNSPGREWDEDEIEARRQAKRDAKRTARRMDKKKQKEDSTGAFGGATSQADAANTGSVRKGTSRLVSLYRALARKLHPDSPISIQGLPAARVLSLWMEVQAAYNSANMERLLAIAAWMSESTGEGESLGFSSSFSSGVLSFSERYDRIRTMKKSCSRLEAKLSQLVAHPAWEFGNVRGKARRKLRQRAARELEEETARTQEVLEALDDFIDSIGPPKPPKGARR